MDELKLYDKHGKEIDVADVVYLFIKTKAIELNKDLDDVFITAYKGRIETYEVVNNGYDGKDLNEIGTSIKIKNQEL